MVISAAKQPLVVIMRMDIIADHDDDCMALSFSPILALALTLALTLTLALSLLPRREQERAHCNILRIYGATAARHAAMAVLPPPYLSDR